MLLSVYKRCYPVTDVALKINYPPYLLTLDFRHEVDFARASATVTDESVQIVIPKVRRHFLSHMICA